MSLRAAAWVLLVIVAGCTARQPGARAIVEPGAPPRALALLVGIDEYAQPLLGTVPALAGPANDMRRARQVLVERFGFAERDVLTLAGAAATHAGIVRAFDEHLLQRAGKGTKVVFWFSGHGSRTLDLSGKETSKTEDIGDGAFDNTLIAYDSREQDLDGAFDLADDELHSLLRALVQRTDQVLVVTDCCHSAGATRGGSQPAPGIRRVGDGRRGVDRGSLSSFWPGAVPLLEDGDVDEVARFPYVHIAACAEDQEAGEMQVGDETFGTLSWFLAEALEGMQPGTSWRELVERVRARVAGTGNRPDQIVSGAGEIDRAVFGNDVVPPLPGFRVDRCGRRLRIAAGRVHGLAEGAAFVIVGLGDGVRRGHARATVMTAAWCLADWSDGDHAEPGEVLRAMPGAETLRTAPLRLHVDGGLDPALLKDVPWAVPSDAATAEFRLQPKENGAVLCDLQGRAVRPVSLEPMALREALFREYTFRALWESVGQLSAWPLALAAESPDEQARAVGVQNSMPLGVVQPLPAGGNGAAVLAVPMTATTGGSLVTMRVTNRSDRALRVTVLSVSEDRAVNIVWPRRDEFDQVLRAGESQAVTVLVGPAVEWSEPRPMVDRYLAIATVDPADFRPFTSQAPVWSPSRGAPPALPGFLCGLLAPTRGGENAAAAAFGFAWCDLHLSAAPVVDDHARDR